MLGILLQCMGASRSALLLVTADNLSLGLAYKLNVIIYV